MQPQQKTQLITAMEPDSTSTPLPTLNGKDRKAFEILVRHHHRRVLGYAFSMCNNEDAAKDIVQDAFVVAWNKLENFDTNKDFGAWVRGIVRNKVKEWSRTLDLVAMDDEILDAIENQHQEWDKQAAGETSDRMFSALSLCIKKLPDLYRDAVDLFYFKKLSGAETASKLDSDPSAIRKRLERARAQLRECVEQTVAVQTD